MTVEGPFRFAALVSSVLLSARLIVVLAFHVLTKAYGWLCVGVGACCVLHFPGMDLKRA